LLKLASKEKRLYLVVVFPEDGLPLLWEWVPVGDDGRKWRWLLAAVMVGRGEDAWCRWGEKMGLGKKKGKKKGFSAAGERIWWRENRVSVLMPVGAVGGRTGVEGEWVWGGGGNLWRGGNEIVSALFYLCFFLLKKKEKKKIDRCGTCHITFVITIA
jgi:hypothetical protein